MIMITISDDWFTPSRIWLEQFFRILFYNSVIPDEENQSRRKVFANQT